jgi:uncharacterized protein YjbI with pentapeptide repeats
MWDAQLQGAFLSWARLDGADLSGANLQEADLLRLFQISTIPKRDYDKQHSSS